MIRTLLVAALVVGACSTSPETAAVDGDWELVDGIEMVDGWPVTMQIDGEQWGARVCNSMGGEIDRSRGRFVVGEIASTAMSCGPEVDAVERDFAEAMASVERAEATEDTLVLSGPGVELVFDRRATVEPAALVDTRWEVESLVSGGTATSVSADPWVEFRSDGSLAGWTGCRDLTGTYVLDGPDIAMTSLAADGECPADLVDQDGRVISVLEAPTAVVDGTQLTLTASGGEALVLVAR